MSGEVISEEGREGHNRNPGFPSTHSVLARWHLLSIHYTRSKARCGHSQCLEEPMRSPASLYVCLQQPGCCCCCCFSPPAGVLLCHSGIPRYTNSRPTDVHAFVSSLPRLCGPCWGWFGPFSNAVITTRQTPLDAPLLPEPRHSQPQPLNTTTQNTQAPQARPS